MWAILDSQGGEGTLLIYNCGDIQDPPERGAFFSKWVIPKARDSQVEVYERVESS